MAAKYRGHEIDVQSKNDRFGNPTKLFRVTKKVDKKSGDELPIFVGMVDIKNLPFRIELSPCNKESKTGRDQMWCKITMYPNDSNNSNSSKSSF